MTYKNTFDKNSESINSHQGLKQEKVFPSLFLTVHLWFVHFGRKKPWFLLPVSSLKEGRERLYLSCLSQVCTTTSSSITTEDERARRSWAPGLKATSCGTETRPEVGTMLTAPGPARLKAWATGTLAAVARHCLLR